MKKLKHIAFAIMGFLVLITPVYNAIGSLHLSIMSSLIFIGSLTALMFVLPSPKNKGNVNVAGIQVEIWVNYIIERLYKDNTFLNFAWNDDDKITGKIVHIPNPGSGPNIAKNRTTFPATASQRTDTDIIYQIDEYTTDPTHIENAEMVELSYNKIDSVLGDHMGYLAQRVGDEAILKWLDESVTVPTKLYTSGAAAAATAPSATGNRKLHVADDVRAIALKMNLANLPQTDRYYMPSANMYDQLLQDLSKTQYRDFSLGADPKTGIIGKLYGLNILDRSATAVVDSTNALKAYGAVAAAGDSEVGIAWQKNCVSRAIGKTDFFENIANPLYYGDIYSALVRMGARRRRADDAGVIEMIQATTA
jgi:hypothetical protein